MKKSNLLICCLIAVAMMINFSCKKGSKTDGDSISSSATQKLKPLVENGKLNLPTDTGGRYILEGDIILSSEQSSIIIERSRKKSDTQTQSTFKADFVTLWPGGKVYYTIDANVPDQYRIINAMADIQNSGVGITFIPRTNQGNYIRVVTTNNPAIGGSSQIGMVGGQQLFEINDSSNADKGTAMHELLHALGMFHEQSRADRDSYIRVLSENIVDNYLSQFNTYVQSNINGNQIGTFDFDSIMLYGSNAFVNSGNPGVYSMTKLDGSPFYAQRSYLSTGDLEGLKYLYQPVYLKFISVEDPESYWNDSGTNEDYHQVNHITVKFFSDVNLTIPLTLKYPLLLNGYHTLANAQGSSSSLVKMLMPAGISESFFADTVDDYRSEYGNITYRYSNIYTVGDGVGYIR